METGFVYALVEREFTKTKEPVVKVGMSRKSNPADRLRGYPKGSFFIWVRHTPTPVRDERLILDTMHIWFRHRKDLGAEYFEGDQNVMTSLLSALMQARESMREPESSDPPGEDEDVVRIPCPPASPPSVRSHCKPTKVDSTFVYDAFAREQVDALSRMAFPSETLFEMFSGFWDRFNPGAPIRVGPAWLERQARGRSGATIRPRISRGSEQSGPMVVFPPLIASSNAGEIVAHPLFSKYAFKHT